MSSGTRLYRHPLLAAEWLQLRASVRRSSGLTVAVVCGFSLLVLALLFLVNADQEMVAAAAHWPIVVALAGLSCVSVIAKRTRRLKDLAARSWLAATPVPTRHRHVALTLRIAGPLLIILLMCSVVAMALAKGQAAAAAVNVLLASVWVGALCGSGVGSLLALKPERLRYEASRYALRYASRYASRYAPRRSSHPSRSAPRAAQALAPSAGALSHWPVAQAFAWGRPENLRVLLIVVLLLAVQAGTSALHGLLIVAAWLVGGYLVSLLAAVPGAALAAARWLRSTPMRPAVFARAIAGRACVHQILGTLVAALALRVLGAPASMTLALCVLWLGVVATVYAASIIGALR